MSARFYKSEIVNRERLEALNGAPFWYVRWSTYWYPHEEGNTEVSYRYLIEHIYGYTLKDYPVLSIHPKHFPKKDRRITLALCRQDNPWTTHGPNFALSEIDDLNLLCMRLKLSGHEIRIQPPTKKSRNFIDVLADPLPFDPRLIEKLSRWKYNIELEETL